MRRVIAIAAIALLGAAAPAQADSVDDAIQVLQQLQQLPTGPLSVPLPMPVAGPALPDPALCIDETDPANDFDCSQPAGAEPPTSLPPYLTLREARSVLARAWTSDMRRLGLKTHVYGCKRGTATRVTCKIAMRTRGSRCRTWGRVTENRDGHDASVGHFRCRRT